MTRSCSLPRLLRAALVLALALGTATALGPPAHAQPAPGPLLHYPLDETAGTVATDRSGNGRNGTVVGGGRWTGGEGLRLDGVDDHIDLPDDLLRGLAAVTVSVQVRIDTAQATPYFVWGLGNTGPDGAGNGYLFTTGDAYRTSISTGNWSGEQTVTAGSALALDRWATLTYTLGGGTAVLYRDGAEVARRTGVTVTPGQIGGGSTTANYVGRSVYTADRRLSGSVRDVRVYGRALTAAEVSALGTVTDAQRVARDAAALDLGDLSAVTGPLTLPVTGPNGATITWASDTPAVLAPDGRVTRPAPGSGPATVRLTATLTAGSATTTRAFTATVPALPSTAERLAAAAAALQVVDAADVRGNLHLPTTGPDGTTVTWSSGAPAVVTATGEVTRPAPGAAPAAVRLTATVALGGRSLARTFDLTVRPLPAPQPMEGYAFAYFTGNTVAGENIHLAASRGNDALRWDELNGGRPVLTSTYGERGLRDPFLIRSPEGDRFFLIATDLSIGRGTSWDTSQRQGSRHIEVWESTDLVTWSEQRHVLVSPPTAGNTWAPEAFWSRELGAYVVYWASKLYSADDPGHTGTTYNRMLYATTRDFRTFSEPRTWQDLGASRIDSTVIEENGVHHRFTKDEGGVTGCSDIIQESNDDLVEADDVAVPGWDPRNPAWTISASCIGRAAGTSAVEGPTVFRANPGDTSGSPYYLFVDEYGGRGYIPLGSPSLTAPQWRVPASYDLPASPRHGTVVPVTARELAALRQDPLPLPATAQGLIASWPGTVDGGRLTDVSGNGNHGTLAGGMTALTFDGVDDHVRLPANATAGLDAVTVAAEVWIDPAQPTPYFLWGLGNTGADGVGNGYLFATGDTLRASISATDWRGEQTAGTGRSLGRGAWHQLTYTLAGGTATLWLDGVAVATRTGVTVTPGALGNGTTAANHLGRSLYSADRYFRGRMRNVSLWNRALGAGEVAALPGNATRVLDVGLGALKVPALIGEGTVVLPVLPGTDLSRLAPALVVAPGSRVSPTGVRDFRTPRTYTVTAADGSSAEWTVSALVMGSPVLPGHFADPNIVRFGDTYYLYTTTDGFDGWSSSTFTVWSSTNLRDWTAHPTILDLGPDVSWADGRAWAPAAIERDGRYYFYFSADQNIGVAVADSPLGPFVDSGRPLVNRADFGGAQQIDPAVFTDDDGRSYLYWGNGTAYVVPLNPDMVSYDPARVRRITGLQDFREGLFMAKHGGRYHLTWSVDDTRSEDYRVGYAVVSDPLATTVENRGVILQKRPELGILGTGHHSMVLDPGTGDWYIAYHRFAIPGGDGTHRETTIDRLTFGADGYLRPVVPTLESVPALSPARVTATPVVECQGPVAHLRVVVRNTGDVPFTAVVSSLFGARSTPNLRPGRESTTHWVTLPRAELPAGTVTVTATPTAGGPPRTIGVAHPGLRC